MGETFEDTAAVTGRYSAVVRHTVYLELWEGKRRGGRHGVADKGMMMARSQPPIAEQRSGALDFGGYGFCLEGRLGLVGEKMECSQKVARQSCLPSFSSHPVVCPFGRATLFVLFGHSVPA